MKFKNFARASAFVLGGSIAVHAHADYTYQLTWQDGASNQLTGSLTVNTLVIPNTTNSTTTYSFGNITSAPTWVTGASVTYGGVTYNDVSGLTRVIARTSGVTLDTSSTNFKSSFTDINLFTFSGSPSCAVGSTTPQGLSPFVLRTCSGSTATDWTLLSVIYGSGSGVSSVNLAPNAYALRSVYNIQSAALNAGLSYDCNVFDKEGICLSTGGRYSTTNSPQATTTSGLLIGSYKYDKNVRLGAWVDQNLSTQNADGIKLSNNAPLFGVFGVWAERNDGLGYEVKVSAGYGDKDVTVTRTSTNEGSSKVNSRGLQTVSSYGIALDSNWIAAPYVGMKYVSLKRGGYTEGGSSALTYDNLRQESTSVITGVKFTGKIDPKTFTVLSAGVEQDLNNNVGQYSAGSSNTTAFNSNVQKTRPVVTAGVFYDIDKTQRVGLNAIHRQEAFQSTASTTALATYTVGF